MSGGGLSNRMANRQEADKHSNLTGAPKKPEWATGTGTENMAAGTSIFDPVLCELVYRWFCPPSGKVLDPFAGGSVRGIVAAVLGRSYMGVDLSGGQIEANRIQAYNICGDKDEVSETTISDGISPIQKHKDIYLKREDLFSVAGIRGAKARTCWHLSQGAKGLVSAGSRQSPQANIVAQIAKNLNIPCHIHTPEGELSAELIDAKMTGAKIVQHKAGYNNVIIARAREDSQKTGWTNIPFGMECKEAISQTMAQVKNIPPEVKRIVIPVGSGMNLAGLLCGLKEENLNIPVLGVKVGADPTKRLNKYAPSGWRNMVKIVDCGIDYHKQVKGEINGIILDPIYEAKCLPYLEKGDLFWIIGVRKSALKKEVILPVWHTGDSRDIKNIIKDEYDLIFSCPPYANLEVYSDDAKDISTLSYPEFIKAYREIIKNCVDMLKDDRFACFVVGDIRDKKGIYCNFVSDTIAAFQDAGTKLYNEAILITAVGSLPIRVGRQFDAGRKLGKTHQNVLVFIKGDPKKATEAIGPVEAGSVEDFGNE